MASMATGLIDLLAYRRAIVLPLQWAQAVPEDITIHDPHMPDKLCAALEWPAPQRLSAKPKAHHFPLLVYTPESGWCLAEQWQNAQDIRVITPDGISYVPWDETLQIVHMPLPVPAGHAEYGSAFAVFRAAILRRKSILTDAGIATVLINLIALATSIFSMQVYDRVIPRGGFSTLWVLTAGVLFALLVDFFIRNSRAAIVDREAAEIDGEVSEYFFARMQAIRLDIRPNGIGTLAAQMRGLDQVRAMMTSASIFILTDLPFALLFIVVMALLGGPVAFVPLLLFPLSLLLAYVFSRLIREDTAKAQVTGNRKNGLLVEALDSSETVKANLGGWHMLAQWNHLVEDVDAHEAQVRRWSALASATFGLMQQLAYVAIVVVGAYLVSLGELTMGGLIACTIISSRINGPLVFSLPNLLIQWGYTRSSLMALNRILEMPSDHPQGRQLVKLPQAQGRIQINALQFAYPGARQGLNLPKWKMEAGERIGMIGPIGSGKSTLLRLLAGLYAPQQGHILLDGIDIQQIREEDLRQHICYVPQDYRVISGTLRDNLALGISNVRDDMLLEAARKTGLIHLINHHPKGLDLPISEGGRGLSGGQRALVGLTRVLLVQPKILLLDEPTASLDQESETRVLQALFHHLDKACSVVLVTHKSQLLSAVQRLVLLVEGQIALDGPNQSVIEALRKNAEQNKAAQTAAQG